MCKKEEHVLLQINYTFNTYQEYNILILNLIFNLYFIQDVKNVTYMAVPVTLIAQKIV